MIPCILALSIAHATTLPPPPPTGFISVEAWPMLDDAGDFMFPTGGALGGSPPGWYYYLRGGDVLAETGAACTKDPYTNNPTPPPPGTHYPEGVSVYAFVYWNDILPDDGGAPGFDPDYVYHATVKLSLKGGAYPAVNYTAATEWYPPLPGDPDYGDAAIGQAYWFCAVYEVTATNPEPTPGSFALKEREQILSNDGPTVFPAALTAVDHFYVDQ